MKSDKQRGMDNRIFDKLAGINDELIAHLKWVLEKHDLASASRLIPIVDRYTVALIEAREKSWRG